MRYINLHLTLTYLFRFADTAAHYGLYRFIMRRV